MKRGIDYIGVSVGGLIFNNKGEVFLNKRSKHTRNEQGSWEAPGGAVDFGELRENAIKREIKEEFGVDIEIIKTLQTSDEILTKDKQHWVPTTYIAKIKGNKKPKIMEPHKSDAIGWFPLDKLPKPLSYITNLDIKAYRDYLKNKETK
jgi:8-oxo-dGTP diphosphatase